MWELVKNGSRLLSRRQHHILSAAGILFFTYGCSAILGILRDRLLYSRFWDCCAAQLDAYNAAFRLPDILFQLLVAGSLSAAFLPVFSQTLLRSKKEAYRLAFSLLNTLTVILLLGGGVIFILAPQLSALITHTFSPSQIQLMAFLTRLMIIAQLFFLWSSFLTAILQTQGRFLLPALSPLVYNGSIILAILIGANTLGIFAPALGVVIGAILHFLVQLPLAKQLGFIWQPSLGLPKSVRRVLRLMVPRIFALGLAEVEATIILFFASALPAGLLSLFYLAQHLMRLPPRLLGATLAQAAFPALSLRAAQARRQKFLRSLTLVIGQACYLGALGTSLLLVLRLPAVRLAFGGATFPWRATIITGKILAFLTPAILAQTINQVLLRAYYSLSDTKTPFFITALSVGLNIIFSWWAVFVAGWGVYGLAAGLSFSSLIQFFGLTFGLLTRFPALVQKSLFGEFCGIGVASILAAVTSWLTMRLSDAYLFDTTRIVGLLATTTTSLTVGTIFYFGTGHLLRLTSAQVFFRWAYSRLRWLTRLSAPAGIPPID